MSPEQAPSLSMLGDPKRDAVLSIDMSNKLKRSFWEDFLKWQTNRIDRDHLSLTITYFDRQPETITLDTLQQKDLSKTDYNALLQHLIDDRILNASKVSLTREN